MLSHSSSPLELIITTIITIASSYLSYYAIGTVINVCMMPDLMLTIILRDKSSQTSLLTSISWGTLLEWVLIKTYWVRISGLKTWNLYFSVTFWGITRQPEVNQHLGKIRQMSLSRFYSPEIKAQREKCVPKMCWLVTDSPLQPPWEHPQRSLTTQSVVWRLEALASPDTKSAKTSTCILTRPPRRQGVRSAALDHWAGDWKLHLPDSTISELI